MEYLHVLMAGLTAIILFIFGLENFSKEIERLAGDHFRKSLSNATKWPIVGVIIGALVTMVIQSSSATSVIAIGLVNAGVLSFKNSVGIIFGSNIGTTVTAQLVAFKMTYFAPIFIILGFFVSLLRSRYSIFGKAIFYFGFVFFSLNLISSSLEPLQHSPGVLKFLTEAHNPLYAIALGCVFTALVQSSSVTTGLAIILTQQGLVSLENAVPLIMGANIGTTSTALIAMFNMDVSAKKAALSHFLFNVGGVVLFTPLLFLFGDRLGQFNQHPAIALANIHLIFNVTTSLIFTLAIGPFTRMVDMLLGEGKMDFERLNLPTYDEQDGFAEIEGKFTEAQVKLFRFLQENYNTVTLSIETNYDGVYEAAGKRLEYTQFVKNEYLHYFSKVVNAIKQEDESKQLMTLINRFDYLFQLHDSINDLFDSKRIMKEQYIELKSDVLLIVRSLSSQTLEFFDDIGDAMEHKQVINAKSLSKALQHNIDDANRALLLLLIDPKREDAGALTNFVTYSQRMKDKLYSFASLTLNQDSVATTFEKSIESA